jgi:hypothetical protein
MKTIKLVVLALVLATLSSCSKDSNIITGGDIIPPPPPPEIYKYVLEEYYEPTVKINETLYVGGDLMYVGREAFTGKYINYETLDTLIIDGKNKYNLKEIRFFGTHDNPSQYDSKYREIKYLKIINLENDNVKIVFDGIYGKIKIGGSNLSLSELNANSYSVWGVWKKADAFEIVDMTKETASFLGGNDIPTLYTNFLGKEVGYVDYANDKREGKKYKLISKTKKSTYGR